jgi:hypothetical protein
VTGASAKSSPILRDPLRRIVGKIELPDAGRTTEPSLDSDYGDVCVFRPAWLRPLKICDERVDFSIETTSHVVAMAVPNDK